MCDINPRQRELDAQLLTLGLNLISKVVDIQLKANEPKASSDVHYAALNAYREGKITKVQYMAVIDALDELAGGDCQKAWVDRDFANALIVKRK